ncbi:hypothetical protein BHM03_00059568, partial [Ensete ventricosum]
PSSVSASRLALEAHGEDEGDDEKPVKATESHVGGKRKVRSPPLPRIGLLTGRRMRRKWMKDEEEVAEG